MQLPVSNPDSIRITTDKVQLIVIIFLVIGDGVSLPVGGDGVSVSIGGVVGEAHVDGSASVGLAGIILITADRIEYVIFTERNLTPQDTIRIAVVLTRSELSDIFKPKGTISIGITFVQLSAVRYGLIDSSGIEVLINCRGSSNVCEEFS